MERARHRKTKSASGIEGIQRIQKQKTVPRLSSDSRSYIDGSNREDMFMLEMGQRTLERATGIPMKKLLAEEMSKDFEPKRRSPSVVARLMGFEGLPSPRHVYRQQKKFPENYQEKNVSINNQRNSQLYDGRSNRRSLMDQQEFKDVYEDLEASHVVNRRCSSRWSANSLLTKPELGLIQQKFMDAKRLSTDEKLQGSKELDDTLEMLDSNRELLLKFLGQSDSLFVKHLHDLQADPDSSLGSHIAVLKPNSGKFESKGKEGRFDRGTSNKPHVASQLKREDGLLLERNSRHKPYTSPNSSKIQVEEMTGEDTLPTRIVVLKPNLGKMQNARASFSSPDHSQGYLPNYKKIKQYPRVGSAETVYRRRKDSSYNTGLSKAMSKEAREIAREITMRMRDSCDEAMDAKSTAYKGYVGDESSNEANESDSDSDPEVFRFSSRRSFDDSNMSRYPSSHLGESPLNMEAKKRLSERWKMTHKYQDLEMISRSSTLGEMLAFPDKKARSYQLNAKMSPGQTSKGLGSSNETAVLDFPLGISSREGWKEEICRTSSRSRSLPPPTGGRGRSHRRSLDPDKLAEEKKLMNTDSVYSGRSKVVKGNISYREHYSAKDSKSRSKTPHPCQHRFANDIDSSSEASFEIQMEPNTKDLSEQRAMFPISDKADCPDVPVNVMMISGPGSTTMPSESSEMPLEQLLSTTASDRVANPKQEELHKESSKQESPQVRCLAAEPESPESSKEAEHPSPVSVLEVPRSEDKSSFEGFESLGADLHELRMQLKLLKMESGACSETTALLPIEEEVQLSPNISEGNHVLSADTWRTSYALDVLIDSGLEESHFNMLKMLWHSSNCPLDPKLFDKLEKKYNDVGFRSERRFLFDRINSALSEIFEEHVNMYPWVMPRVAGLHLQWQSVQDALERLIDDQDYAGSREIAEREVDREMVWSDYKGEIELLGNEIEKLLIDDMITEVICD